MSEVIGPEALLVSLALLVAVVYPKLGVSVVCTRRKIFRVDCGTPPNKRRFCAELLRLLFGRFCSSLRRYQCHLCTMSSATCWPRTRSQAGG